MVEHYGVKGWDSASAASCEQDTIFWGIPDLFGRETIVGTQSDTTEASDAHVAIAGKGED
jgi:hypothetical protein